MLPNGIMVALESMLTILLTYPVNECTQYWHKRIDLARCAVWKGTVQKSYSNPVAYWLVALAGSNGQGNPSAKRDAIKQFEFVLAHGLMSDADQPFRSNRHNLSGEAQRAGLFNAVAKRDSSWGTMEERSLSTQRSTAYREGFNRNIEAPETIPTVSRIIIAKD